MWDHRCRDISGLDGPKVATEQYRITSLYAACRFKLNSTRVLVYAGVYQHVAVYGVKTGFLVKDVYIPLIAVCNHASATKHKQHSQ